LHFLAGEAIGDYSELTRRLAIGQRLKHDLVAPLRFR
jgi:hypothetical protein